MDKRKLQTFWQPGGDKPHGRIQTLNFGAERIANMCEQPDQNAKEYADELVRRWNHFPALVEALKGLVQTIEYQAEANLLNEDADEGEENDLTIAREALKAATE